MTDRLKLSIAGAAGRMGRQLIDVGTARGHQIIGGTEAPKSDQLGVDLGELSGGAAMHIHTVSEPAVAAAGADIWLDFTQPVATLAALKTLPGLGVRAAIIGTTGFTPAQETELTQAARKIAVVKAGNFSLGINLLQALVAQAAARLGPDWDIEILETHHRHKLDAPSGTALMLAEAAAQGRGSSLDALRAAPYDGPNAPRQMGEIGFAVRRSGGVIGAHSVSFGADQEEIVLSHNALDRSVFAHGAIRAAEWAVDQPPGLYKLDHVLGIV